MTIRIELKCLKCNKETRKEVTLPITPLYTCDCGECLTVKYIEEVVEK